MCSVDGSIDHILIERFHGDCSEIMGRLSVMRTPGYLFLVSLYAYACMQCLRYPV